MMKLHTIIVSALILFPSLTMAETVIVVRGPYKLTFENKYSPERSKLIADAVASALKSSGDIVPVPMDIECKDSVCLERIADENGADNAVLVSVEEGAAYYNYKVLTLNENLEGETSGRFEEAKKQIEDLVIKALQKPKSPPSTIQDSGPSEKVPANAEEKDPPKGETSFPKIDKKEQGLKTAVWISLSITGASALTWGILHSVGYAKLKTYTEKEQQDRTAAEKKQLENLRVSTFVLIGITATSFVATGAIFGVTAHKRKASGSMSLIPALEPDGGCLILRGSF